MEKNIVQIKEGSRSEEIINYHLRREKVIKGIELSINHIKSKKEGEVFATARVIHKGRTTHLWEVKIVDEEDNLISICKLTNIILDKK